MVFLIFFSHPDDFLATALGPDLFGIDAEPEISLVRLAHSEKLIEHII